MAYEGTSVPVDKSQGAIRKLLRGYGAERFAFGQDLIGGTTYAVVRFVVEGNEVRLRVPVKEPTPEEIRERARRAKKRAAYADPFEQEERRIWRVIHYNLKARMEAVENDVETFVQAWLAHVVNPATGRTIYEELAETGRVELPAALALEAGEKG